MLNHIFFLVFIIIIIDVVQLRELVCVNEMKQSPKGNGMHIFNGYALPTIVPHRPVERRFEDRRPHREDELVRMENLVSDLERHVRFLPRLQQILKIIHQAQKRHSDHEPRLGLRRLRFLQPDNSELATNEYGVADDVRRRLEHAPLGEPGEAPGGGPMGGAEHHGLRRVRPHEVSGRPRGRGLPDERERVERPHVGALRHELEVDGDAVLARLHVAVGVVADAPVVAADGEGRGLDEPADAEPLVHVVALDPEHARALRRLRGAGRGRRRRRRRRRPARALGRRGGHCGRFWWRVYGRRRQ